MKTYVQQGQYAKVPTLGGREGGRGKGGLEKTSPASPGFRAYLFKVCFGYNKVVLPCFSFMQNFHTLKGFLENANHPLQTPILEHWRMIAVEARN